MFGSVAEDNPGTERKETLRLDSGRRPFGDAEALSGTSDQCRIADRVGRRDEQETSRFVRKSGQPSCEALLDTRRQRHVRGQPEAARELRRRQAARQLEQRERIPARLVDDPVKHALVQRGRQDGLQERPRVPVSQRLDAELWKARERAAQLARREHERDLLRQQAPGDERECACRPSIEPLRVVDDGQQRPVFGNLRQQPQDRQPHEERVRRRSRIHAEGDAESIALRLWQSLLQLEER
jgi:hypothetical protein